MKMQKNRVVKMPIIGKIKVGRKNEKGFPESLDYFVATGNYERYFIDAFGEKPSSIEIMFLSNNFEESCNERYELRQGAKLYAYGDGDIFQIYDEQKDDYIEKTMEKDKEFINALHTKLKSKWETVLHMSFLIPAIRGVFGVWQLSTKGEKSSIPTIQGAFKLVQNMAGTVIGIPFDLQVKKVVSNKPNSKSKFAVINLIPNVSSGHMEKVKTFISGRNEFIGLLTENKIDDIAMNEISKRVEYVPPDAIEGL
jgi:hypothetical protein